MEDNGMLNCANLKAALTKLNMLPNDTKTAIEYFTILLANDMSPMLIAFKNIFSTSAEQTNDEHELFFLSHNLILKYINVLVDILKEETENSSVLTDSRNWAVLRIVSCLEKIIEHIEKSSIEPKAENVSSGCFLQSFDEDEFITWVDDGLDILDRLMELFRDDSNNIHLKNGKEEVYNSWKCECSSSVVKLNTIIREMVAAAMKICQNCLPSDQNIIVARCHVVFRESKSLADEVLKTDLSTTDGLNIHNVKVKDDLHYPTVRLLNDILRDAMYNLEASINRAVLGLVLNCMVYPVEPLQKAIQEQRTLKILTPKQSSSMIKRDRGSLIKGNENGDENDPYVDAFDIHNEQLLQIGFFAVSCSADKQRILLLKSCLASLETLEPHLVPSFLSDPDGMHSQILANHWATEISSLRALVFLIIDPVAFIELVIEMYRAQLLDMKKELSLQWSSVQHLIGLGKCVLDFIQIYIIHEPNCLPQLNKISNYVPDMIKVLKECRVVCDMFLENPEKPIQLVEKDLVETAKTNEQKHNEVRILKRLKLLYAILLNISKIIIGEQSQEEEDTSDTEQSEMNDKQKNNYVDNITDIETAIDTTRIIPFKSRSKQNTHCTRKPQKNKGILGILENFKGNIQHGTLFGSNANKDNRTAKLLAVNKTFSRSYIARKTPNYKKRNTSQKRILKLMEYQRKRSVSTLILKSDEFLLADISKQDHKSVIQHITELTHDSMFNDKCSERVVSLLNENSKMSRKHRRSLRKQLLKNQVVNNSKLNKSVVNYSSLRGKSATNKIVTNNPADISVKVLDSTHMDWHITDILEQLTGLSDTLSLLRMDECDNSNKSLCKDPPKTSKKEECNKQMQDISVIDNKHIITLKINDIQMCSPKKIWNIKVNDHSYNPNRSSNQTSSDITTHVSSSINCEIDMSFGSNIPTPERLNDIYRLEQKIAHLKQFWKT